MSHVLIAFSRPSSSNDALMIARDAGHKQCAADALHIERNRSVALIKS